MKKYRLLFSLCAVTATAFTVNCRSVDVSKVERNKHTLQNLCILENRDVSIDEFLDALKAGLTERGFTPTVIQRESTNCTYTLTYAANQFWDMAMYISHITLVMSRDGVIVGRATYKSGVWFNKYGSAEEKLQIVLDPLLEDFRRPGS